MIVDNVGTPKVTHGKGEAKIATKIMRKVLPKISDHLERKLTDLIKAKDTPNWNGDDKDLLNWRRMLVGMVKEGMLDRKDKEVEIIAVAIMVYMNRLSHEERLALIEEW